MNFLVCGYRDWALRVHQNIANDFPEHTFPLVRDEKEFNILINDKKRIDAILCIGWSWIIPGNVVENIPCVGVHPSDLPEYAGGSPLQNQIIDGVIQSKNSLFRLSTELDHGPVLIQTDLDLSGHIKDIFLQLEKTSIELFRIFIKSFPTSLNLNSKNNKGILRKQKKRLQPKDSLLTAEKMKDMSCIELYNFIRCREDPYPNVFMTDDSGTLYFKFVEFFPGKK